MKPLHAIAALTLLIPLTLPAQQPGSQHKPLLEDQAPEPHRTRLILKDGSYQIVMSYRVVGQVVHYISAERGGAEEEIPLSLVDLDATHRWEQRHTAHPDGAPEIDPELLKEEADRAALTPEVAKDLRLPEDSSTLVLDTFHGTPELVPLAQTDSDLNRNTAHNVLRAALNPLAAAHPILTLKGETSPIQLHVADPVLYLRIGDESVPDTAGTPLTVDTHGATSRAPKDSNDPPGGAATSRYVIVRADVRRGERVISSIRINQLGTGQHQPDLVETTTQLLPGGHWLKITPSYPLDFGEFALMEVISDKSVNLGVWDFGVHPVAAENRDIIKPDPRRPATLGHHAATPDSDSN